MIPTVALLAYFHGRPGKKWPRFEKIGIPTNMFASVLLLVFIFHNKDLGAATASVTLVNEEGEQIERVIPKSEFRKMIFVFFFDNESADPTLNWLQYGITDLLGWDLEQDPFLYSLTGRFGLIKEYEPGYSEGIGLPLTLKRKIAKHWDHDYFLSGSFAKKDGGLIVTISLYETKRCKLIKERAFEGKDIFELVDRISVQLKRDLGIPSHYIETVEDLPVSEMMTNSIPAFKKYSLGLNASQFHNDYETAVRYLEESVKEDSTFALGYFMLHHHYRYNLGHSKEAEKAMSATMKYVYRLSEKSQFYFKELYYDMRGESDKKFALLKMVVELYPDEAWAHSSLAWEHETRNQLDDALIEYKRVLELEPECDLNLRIIAVKKRWQVLTLDNCCI
jgi:tetratricopeptide (TPR) repeat protein